MMASRLASLGCRSFLHHLQPKPSFLFVNRPLPHFSQRLLNTSRLNRQPTPPVPISTTRGYQATVIAALVGFGYYLVAEGARRRGFREEPKNEFKPKEDYQYSFFENFGLKVERFFIRLENRWLNIIDPIWMPANPMLPNENLDLFRRKPTLVVDIDVLITHEYGEGLGWITRKRPGAEIFLANLADQYELVVFSDRSYYVDNFTMMSLDPAMTSIQYAFFQEACRRNDDGLYVKDIRYLGRDPKKTVLLDTKKHNIEAHPYNAVWVPPFTGEDSMDNTLALMQVWLFGLIPYIKTHDVRSLIKKINEEKISVAEVMRQRWIDEGKIERMAWIIANEVDPEGLRNYQAIIHQHELDRQIDDMRAHENRLPDDWSLLAPETDRDFEPRWDPNTGYIYEPMGPQWLPTAPTFKSPRATHIIVSKDRMGNDNTSTGSYNNSEPLISMEQDPNRYQSPLSPMQQARESHEMAREIDKLIQRQRPKQGQEKE
eukprot:TRINITY_DN8522_c0_g1_i1.p1 TRINITY_DN8522_c0_g1~~TRINITY_DN8522_c0_g1_i1.p1  ORF type:complete len:487 (+),score=87.72 TRINITY_DN8522_c0_g1_i1:120-1580(+)